MSEVGLTEAELDQEFERLSDAKGDRLAELIEGDDDASDNPETPDVPVTPATPEPAPAAPAAGAQPAQTPTTPAAAPAAAAPDIWANAPAELRDAHQRAIALADQKYRSDIGRQASYQRRIQSLEDENKALRTGKAAAAPTGTQPQPQVTPAAQPSGQQPQPQAQPTRLRLRDDPAIKRSLEEYPDVVEPLLGITEKLEDQLEDIRRDVSLSNEERRDQTIAAQEAALDAAHPDWRNAVRSPEFSDWLSAQPKFVKDAIERNANDITDAEEAITVMSNFKAHYALTHPTQAQPQPQPKADPANPASHQPANLNARRQAQLHAATGGRTGSNGPAAIPDGPSNDAGEDAMFNHFAAKKAASRR